MRLNSQFRSLAYSKSRNVCFQNDACHYLNSVLKGIEMYFSSRIWSNRYNNHRFLICFKYLFVQPYKTTTSTHLKP